MLLRGFVRAREVPREARLRSSLRLTSCET